MVPISVFVFAGLLLLVLLIAVLLGASREQFLNKWMPPLIAGLFLAGIVPYANDLYWKRQKDYDQCVQDREKRYELLGSVTRTYTHLFKIHTRLNSLAKELSHEEGLLRRLTSETSASNHVVQVHTSRLAVLIAERSDLRKERSRLEGQIAADSALIARFYDTTILKRHSELAILYDRRTSEPASFVPTAEDPIVKGVFELAALMAAEGAKHDCN